MPRRKKIFGICRICGLHRQLSFEHVPPRAAFNNKRTIKLKFEDAIALGPGEIVKGPIQQGGIGDHTLCIRCNNLTGAWYGAQFVDWCYQAMDILIKSGGKPSLIYMNYLYPLPIFKQIVTMFFSVNPVSFRVAHPELVQFVLDKERKYLPPKYRFFVYYNIGDKLRHVGVSTRLQHDDLLNTVGSPVRMSEINFPPFGYLMTINSQPPDSRLFEITHFSRHDYSELRVMTLKLPVLPTHTIYPGDYRTKQEILAQASRSKRQDGVDT